MTAGVRRGERGERREERGERREKREERRGAELSSRVTLNRVE